MWQASGERPQRSAYDTAVRLLAKRDHAKLELAQKLEQRGYESAEINTAITQCLEGNYLDDQRFTGYFVAARYNKGFGPRRIALELSERGIHNAQQYLQEHDWDAAMLARFIKHYGQAEHEFNGRAKQAKYLINRGFDPDDALALVNRLFKDDQAL